MELRVNMSLNTKTSLRQVKGRLMNHMHTSHVMNTPGVMTLFYCKSTCDRPGYGIWCVKEYTEYMCTGMREWYQTCTHHQFRALLLFTCPCATLLTYKARSQSCEKNSSARHPTGCTLPIPPPVSLQVLLGYRLSREGWGGGCRHALLHDKSMLKSTSV